MILGFRTAVRMEPVEHGPSGSEPNADVSTVTARLDAFDIALAGGRLAVADRLLTDAHRAAITVKLSREERGRILKRLRESRLDTMRR